MRNAYRLFIILIVIFLSATACKGSKLREDKPLDKIPLIKNVQSIVVKKLTGSEIISEFQSEPSGELYKVVIKSQLETVTYTINDLRETSSNYYSVKIHTQRPEGPNDVWELPSEWMQSLLRQSSNIEEEEPLLYMNVNKDNNSVVVQANRNIDKESASDAIQNTLESSELTIEKEDIDYQIYWSDPRRFVIHFTNLVDGSAVQFHLDHAVSEEGELFVSESRPLRNHVVVYGNNPYSSLRWIDTEKLSEHEKRLESANLIQTVSMQRSGITSDAILVYHRDQRISLIDLTTRRLQPILLSEWPDQMKEPFGNDYGTELLFANTFSGDMAYVIKGNRTLFRVNWETGKTHKLYESEVPIRGVASSPDFSRIAILSVSDPFLGPKSDLIVMDNNGEEFYINQDIPFVARSSDGFLFIYPMKWEDDHTITVPVINGEEQIYNGKSFIDLQDGSIETVAGEMLPGEATQLLESYVGARVEVTGVLRGPSSEKVRYYAVQTDGRGCWLLDMETDETTWLGRGTLVSWTSPSELIMWHSEEETATFISVE